MEISILVLCYEYTGFTKQTINTILDTATLDYNLIIHPNKAHSAANSNFLINRSPTEYMILVDDDLKFTQKGWDAKLMETLTTTPNAGCVVPRLFSSDGKNINAQSAVKKDSIVTGIKAAGAVMAFKDCGIRNDEHYVKTQYNDTDFLYQFIKEGMLVIVDGRVDVLHMKEATVGKGYTKETKANKAYFNKKWGKSDSTGWGTKAAIK